MTVDFFIYYVRKNFVSLSPIFDFLILENGDTS